LNLRANFIRTEGAIALADALKVNNALQSLILDASDIDYAGNQALQSLNKKGIPIYGI
jgi:hypothetical protein